MSDKKLKRLFDYQKFEGNSAMNFAIQSARSYIDSLQNTASMFELDDEELDMVNAAGVLEQRLNSRPIKHPCSPNDRESL